MSTELTFNERFFDGEVKEISVSSSERAIFPYQAKGIAYQGGMVSIQMLPGRPIDLIKNEKICVTFVKQNQVHRFSAVVQTYGVRGPLKLVAQPVSEIEQILKRDHDRVDCQIQVYLAERVEIRGRWGNKVEETGTIVNISGAGVQIRVRYDTKVKATFKIRFFLPCSSLSISAYMEVVRIEPVFPEGEAGEQLIAMKYLTLPEHMHQAIEQYVEGVMADQPSQ
jgi:hypothetical protein